MRRADGAQLDGKYRLSGGDGEAAVEMWKVVGPHNATLRASVSLQHCLPVAEETFSLADGMSRNAVQVYLYCNVMVVTWWGCPVRPNCWEDNASTPPPGL